MDLQDIEKMARRYGDAHRALAEEMAALEADRHDATRRRLPAIRRLTEKAAKEKAALAAAVEASPGLFKRPRTRVLHGVRVGIAKGKGRLDWANTTKLIAAIKKLMPDRVDALIKTDERPLRAALNTLPGVDLRRLGVTVTGDGDQVVVQPTDGEVDKLVEALLRGAEERETA